MKMEISAKTADKIVKGDLVSFGNEGFKVVTAVENGKNGIKIYGDRLKKPLVTSKKRTIIINEVPNGNKLAKCLVAGDFIVLRPKFENPQVVTIEKIEKSIYTTNQIRVNVKEFARVLTFGGDEPVEIYKWKMLNGKPMRDFWRYCDENV